MSVATAPAPPTPSPWPAGPTLVLIGVFLAVAAGGALAQHQSAGQAALPAPPSPVLFYLSLMAVEWGLVLYVWRAGLRGDTAALRELIGGRWRSPGDVAGDGALALALWALWGGLDRLLDAWRGGEGAASVASWLPHGPLQVGLWVGLSLSAGFAEELVFRGYLQRQLRTITGNAVVAVVLQAVLFGISHGYQGLRATAKITAYALLFTALATWRRSLRPGMLAHAWTDVAAGVLRI